jgi:hypothetical protein
MSPHIMPRAPGDAQAPCVLCSTSSSYQGLARARAWVALCESRADTLSATSPRCVGRFMRRPDAAPSRRLHRSLCGEPSRERPGRAAGAHLALFH